MKHHTRRHAFGVEEILLELKHFLPAQAPLKDFVHHNTLHAFQHLPFFQALKQGNAQFGYKGFLPLQEYRKRYHEGKIKEEILQKVLIENFGAKDSVHWVVKLFDEMYEENRLPKLGVFRAHWKDDYHFNLDKVVHPFLFRILAAYLDQGISIWSFPLDASGLLDAVRILQQQSFSKILKSQRAIKLLLDPDLKLESLLEILVGNPDSYGWYLFDQQFAHPGWSGMVSVLEDQPHSLLDPKIIKFENLIKLECLFEIDALDQKFGENWNPIGIRFPHPTKELFENSPFEELDMVLQCWQEAFEWSFYDEVLAGIAGVKKEKELADVPKFQALFCIDDRECSTRRHLEFIEPGCATYGTPGFFNVEFYYKPQFGKFNTKLCPAPISPKHLIKENSSRKKLDRDVHFHQNNHSLFRGWLSAQTLGFWSALKLVGNILSPSASSALEVSSSKHMDPESTLSVEFTGLYEDGLQVGFKPEEMADRVEGLLKSIGLVDNFSPLIYIIGHGASSINNTHYAGYDCGACSGRPGSVNARVVAKLANLLNVRSLLKDRGIVIPDSTQFIGALHDTTKDELSYFDPEILSEINRSAHESNKLIFDKTLAVNALERSRRFDTLSKNKSISKLHSAVKKRAFSLFEPRPEYNHATNALCIVSRKSTLKGLFLDRRAFLNSYDYRKDQEGKALAKILGAAAPVCGGINLEYYFSRMDNEKLGAGTKLPHNVMGLIGVANGADGDLRTGLPYQMVEIHDPVRLLMIVEQDPSTVLRVLEQNPATYEWFKNYWIHLVIIDPSTKNFLRFKDGGFEKYHPESKVGHLSHLQETLLNSKENLPVYQIDSL